MDEVIEQFQTSFTTEQGKEISDFEGLYKNWGKLGHQEERRKELLETQKTNRNNKLDNYRGILEIVQSVEQQNVYKNHGKAVYQPSIYVSGFNKRPLTYRNILMLSEWMIEKPVDFNENWYVVPCPIGIRTLMIAYQGKTKLYTKYGQFRFETSTALPGGNRRNYKKNQCCVLDCFYDDKLETMYILDILAWNCQPMTDGETEFRHYWLQTQMAEIPGLQVRSKHNAFIFKIIPKISCDDQSFRNFMLQFPAFPDNSPSLDGLLFYHKHSRYYCGKTPLVGWLYPYMVPEVLGSDIPLHIKYEEQKPEDYVSQKDFIEKFEAKLAKKQGKYRNYRKSTSMDTTDPDTNNSDNTQAEAISETPVPETDTMESETIESESVAEPSEQNDQAEQSLDSRPKEGMTEEVDK